MTPAFIAVVFVLVLLVWSPDRFVEGSAGIRFYCKPVTLVRCRKIGEENRFSGRVGGKWLCDVISAFSINELRGARALRLFCGRSAFPPPDCKKWVA